MTCILTVRLKCNNDIKVDVDFCHNTLYLEFVRGQPHPLMYPMGVGCAVCSIAQPALTPKGWIDHLIIA